VTKIPQYFSLTLTLLEEQTLVSIQSRTLAAGLHEHHAANARKKNLADTEGLAQSRRQHKLMIEFLRGRDS
jgi:hypothetical protein